MTGPESATVRCATIQSFAYLGTVVSLGFVKDPAVAKLLSTHIGTKIMNTLVVSPHILSILRRWVL